MGPGSPPDGFELSRSAFDDACIGMAIVAPDGRLVRVNPGLCRLTGHPEARLLGGDGLATLVREDARDALIARWQQVRGGGEDDGSGDDVPLVCADGASCWARLRIGPAHTHDGSGGHLLVQFLDISARRAAERTAVRLACHRDALATLGQIAMEASRADDLASAAVAAILGALDVDVVAITRRLSDGGHLVAVAGEDRRGFRGPGTAEVDPSHARLALELGSEVAFEDRDARAGFDPEGLHIRGLRSGVALPVLCSGCDPGVLAVYRRTAGPFADEDLDLLRAIVKLLNGTAQRIQSEDELLRQSLYDTVTEVPNRRFLLSAVAALAQGRGDLSLAIISLGVVNRRQIHESLGHDAGDRFLREIGQRIAMRLTLDETLARSDGDEFVVLSPELGSREQVLGRVQRLLERIRIPVTIEGLDLPPHVVAGVMIAPLRGPGRPEELVRDASTAMYRAMSEEREIVVFDEAMRAETVERLSLVAELRRAIEKGALHLAFQPVVSRAQARVTKFEALVRWSHPLLGEIPPDRFVPLAESHGLIGRLGSYVLAEALDQLVCWKDLGDTLGDRQMSVNISRAQLDDPGLVDEILSAVRDRGLTPSSLLIEVTESALAGDAQAAIESVRALSAAGVCIALDDFGVGQSSLASLTELPLDVLKLDRSLVSQVAGSHQRVAIISAVAQIARELQLKVVAEGIETADEAAITERLGCDMAQGWFYARPTTARDLHAVVAALDGALCSRRLLAS